jgi:hypothetical protein
MNIKLSATVSGKVFSADGVVDAIRQGLKDATDIIDDSFEESQSTFNSKATFQRDIGLYEATVWTTSKPYIYVAGGTSVRYATMAPGYKPKTPPMLPPHGGGGSVAFISRKHPRPGIKARNPQDLIAKRDKPKVVEAMRASIEAAL